MMRAERAAKETDQKAECCSCCPSFCTCRFTIIVVTISTLLFITFAVLATWPYGWRHEQTVFEGAGVRLDIVIFSNERVVTIDHTLTVPKEYYGELEMAGFQLFFAYIPYGKKSGSMRDDIRIEEAAQKFGKEVERWDILW